MHEQPHYSEHVPKSYHEALGSSAVAESILRIVNDQLPNYVDPTEPEQTVNAVIATLPGTDDVVMVPADKVNYYLEKLQGRALRHVVFGNIEGERYLQVSPHTYQADELLKTDEAFNTSEIWGNDEGANRIEIRDSENGPVINDVSPELAEEIDSNMPHSQSVLHQLKRVAERISVAKEAA